MKSRLFMLVLVVFFMVFLSPVHGFDRSATSPGGRSVTSPVSSPVNSPVSSPTVPVSTGGGSLIATQPESSSNYNSVSGRHFRGIVPYRRSSYQSSGADSSSLDTFIRRSSAISYKGHGYVRTQDFYVPSEAVTTPRKNYLSSPGPSGQTTRRTDYTGYTDNQAKVRPFYDQRPMASSISELERLMSKDIGLDRFKIPDSELLPYWVKEKKKLEEQEDVTDKSEQPPKPPEPDLLTVQQLKEKEKKSEPESTDIHDQLFLELQKQPGQPSMPVLPRGLKQSDKGASTDKAESKSIADKYKPKLPEIKELTDAERANARKILGEHKTFENYVKARFDRYMEVAAALMKTGKYYRAADSYTLADVFDRDNPDALIGRAHALFAAGEYMSSSYFVEKAFAISPERAGLKVDLVELLGDRDVFDDRILEITDWQDQTGSAPLTFLMAYIFYQTGDLDEAEISIYAVIREMSDSRGVMAFKKVLEAAIGGAR